jgi:hypothetical protein
MRLLRMVSVLLIVIVPALAADNPFTGTWKLNLAKSRLLPGDTTKSDIYRAVAGESTIRITEHVSDGKGLHDITVDAKFDGKDYPVKGDLVSDSVAYHRLSADRIKVITKKGAQITAKAIAAVSRNRKTIIVNFTVYEHGEARKGMAVYEKQPD